MNGQYSIIIKHSSIILILLTTVNFFILYFTNYSFGAFYIAPLSQNGPTIINDPHLEVEQVNDNRINKSTSMSIIDKNTIFVTQKDTGKIIELYNGKVQPNPIFDAQVANMQERGLLGIAISKHNDTGKTYVFLYYTESGNGVDGSDTTTGTDPLGNRLYRYEYIDGKLVNPLLLLDLPAIPANGRAEHNGGKIRIGPDNNVYVVIGDVGGYKTKAQNNKTGLPPNGSGGILFVTFDGKKPDKTFLNQNGPLDKYYYAIGIRNSFGIDFDPVTGTLWDTENGPSSYDEINMVKPGFNSGWSIFQGKSDFGNNVIEKKINKIKSNGIGNYSDPKFVWNITIGPTALKFLNSDKLGKEYENNMFVGDINNGYLYRFTLNNERDDITFDDSNYHDNKVINLKDNIANSPNEINPIIFGQGFGGITDLQVGPDGYLYVLNHYGDIFKVKSTTIKDKNKSKTHLIDNFINSSNNHFTKYKNINDLNLVNLKKINITGIKGSKSYSPNPVKITIGQTIIWENDDIISHTVTSVEADNKNKSKLFDSQAILSGQTFVKTFDTAGKYNYYCFYHPAMKGEIWVE